MKLRIPVLTVLLPCWCSVGMPYRDLVDRRSIHLIEVRVYSLLGRHVHVPKSPIVSSDSSCSAARGVHVPVRDSNEANAANDVA